MKDIESKSSSSEEMIVEYIDAMELLHIYAQNNIKVIGWEGWIKYSNGSLGHSQKHMGTTDLSSMTNLSALSLIKSTIMQAHTEWELIPEFEDSTLLFCITTDT